MQGSYCFAGKEWDDGKIGKWIRPINDPSQGASGKAITESDQRLVASGDIAKLLDIVQVPLLKRAPNDYQPENYLIVPGHSWHRNQRFEEDLSKLLDNPKELWNNYGEKNDRVKTTEARALVKKGTGSLYFIEGESVKFSRNVYDQRQLRAKFTYNRVEYDFSVTDPEAKNKYLRNTETEAQNMYLCVSLAEPYTEKPNYCFKLVAGVIHA